MNAVKGPSLSLGLLLVLASCKDSDLSRADAFLQLEDWPRAIALYDQIVQANPLQPEPRMGLALARAGAERESSNSGLDSATDWLSVARDFAIVERLDTNLSTSNDRADALFHAALCWQRDGHLPQAKHAAEDAQALHARHAPSAQYLGTLARSEGDQASAERWFTRAISVDSSYLPAWASLGELARDEGDPEAAILYWEEALKRNPKHPWFLKMVAQVRDSLGLVKR